MMKRKESNRKEGTAVRALAHAVPKYSKLRMVDGRLVGPTLADRGMDAKVKNAEKELFPTREKAIEHFHKQGVLTKAGKLTKAYGG